MSDDKLSQNDIDALIAKMTGANPANKPKEIHDQLGISEIELKGIKKLFEVSINASSEVLMSITQKDIKVDSIGEVKLAGRKELSKLIEPPFISTKVDYTVGLRGLELLLIKQSDMNKLMHLQFQAMGFDPPEGDDEFILSASQELMNQMLGNTAAKVGEVLNILVDISTPNAQIISEDSEIVDLKEDSESYIYTTFRLNIDGQISGDLIKVLDTDFKDELIGLMNKTTFLDEWKETDVENTLTIHNDDNISDLEESVDETSNIEPVASISESYSEMDMQFGGSISMEGQNYQKPRNIVEGSDVQVSKFQLPQLSHSPLMQHQQGTTNRIKDVEIDLTVELGRTKMRVKEILELDKGSIIELNRLAGEHVDLYANGTLICKGEVVVIKDNFAFRVLNIIDKEYR